MKQVTGTSTATPTDNVTDSSTTEAASGSQRRPAAGTSEMICGCPADSHLPGATLACIRASSASDASFPVRYLDRLIVAANRMRIGGLAYKPYWLLTDIAAAAGLAFAWLFSVRFTEVSFLGLGAGIAGALVIYKLFREAKAALGGTAARSFLQDCLLVIIPAFLAINLAFGNPIALVTAFLGLLMPLYGGIARIGCFLGGCCYGKPCRNGVTYPSSLFKSNDAGWRRFSPGPDPGQRVFPIQLIEAAAQLTIFSGLAVFVWEAADMAKYILLLYLTLYALVRFGLDFFRTTSARPRHGRFSEAQLVCVGVLFAASLALAVVQTASTIGQTDGVHVAEHINAREAGQPADRATVRAVSAQGPIESGLSRRLAWGGPL